MSLLVLLSTCLLLILVFLSGLFYEYFFSTSRNLSAAACVKLHMEFVLSGSESVWGKLNQARVFSHSQPFHPTLLIHFHSVYVKNPSH